MRTRKAVYPFIIVLKNQQQKAIRTTGVLLGLISMVLFAYRAFLPEGSGLNWLAAGIVALLLSRNIWEMSRQKTTGFLPLLLVASAGLAVFPPHSPFALLFLLLAWLEKEARAAQEIGFTEDHILLNGLWPKKIYWPELNNVVLKDGILTIDFKNNRLFQKETDDLEDEEYDGEEDEFNIFCQHMLNPQAAAPQK